jgi:hypothetical protein
MRWVIWTVVAPIGIVGTVAVIGYFLPVNHEASRSAEFTRPPEAVFALVSDLGNYRSWWDGAEVKSEVVESVPPSKLVTKIVGESAFGGTWTMEIAPSGTGSRMTITERGEIYNPIFRALARFVFGYTGTMESLLKAAQQRLGP